MSVKKILIVEAAELDKMIVGVKTSGVRFDALVQRAAVQCVAQSILHGNTTPANALYEALPKGSRRDSLVAWFEKYGNFAWMKGERKLAYFKAKSAADWTDEYAAEVAASMWTTGTKPAEPKSVYDMEEEVSKFLDRMGKLAGDSTKNVKHKDLLDSLKKVYAAYVVEGFTTGEEAPASNDGEEAPRTGTEG